MLLARFTWVDVSSRNLGLTRKEGGKGAIRFQSDLYGLGTLPRRNGARVAAVMLQERAGRARMAHESAGNRSTVGAPCLGSLALERAPHSVHLFSTRRSPADARAARRRDALMTLTFERR